MAGFTTRVAGTPVLQEQLRRLAKKKKTTVAQLVAEALEEVYGKELAELYADAFSLIEGGHDVNQTTQTGTKKGRKS